MPVHPLVRVGIKQQLTANGRSLGRKSGRETYLFETRQSPRMSTARAWQIVKWLAGEAEIEKLISLHSLWCMTAIDTLWAGPGAVIV